MPTAYCEPEDVRDALQEHELTGSYDSHIVEPAIRGASGWFARQTNGHWFDSNLDSDINLRDTSANSATGVQLSVPSGPHATDRQLVSSLRHARYPLTNAGPYAEIVLPHLYVTDLTKLEVRDRGGDVDDWVADGDISSGVGNEYYIQQRGQNSYGRTYLYIDTNAIGARTDFTGLLTLEYDYGLDAQADSWEDVKRGIAALSAAEVVSDDQVIAQIPDNGNLIGVETQHQQLMDKANNYLGEYLSAMGDNR